MNNISLNMIIGPYDEPFLEAAIESVLPILSEIILVDTAPGDNPNRAAMESFKSATIIDLPRPSDEEFSFAVARNVAKDATTKKWVLRLDADEIMPAQYLDRLAELTTKKCEAVEVSFWHHFLHPDLIRPLIGTEDKKVILMKTECFTWSRPVHEGSHIFGNTYRAHEIKYNHYGYCRGQGRIKDSWTLYKKLGGCEHTIEHIGREHFLEEVMGDIGLLPYEGEHPAVVIHKLRELYPDLGCHNG
jgi:glycosyltransferase involved in cell wall biosynthesis